MSCVTSENVCRDFQNGQYCFYRYCHNMFDVTMTDNLQYQSEGH